MQQIEQMFLGEMGEHSNLKQQLDCDNNYKENGK